MINIKQFLLSFLICAGLEPCIFARTKIPVQNKVGFAPNTGGSIIVNVNYQGAQYYLPILATNIHHNLYVNRSGHNQLSINVDSYETEEAEYLVEIVSPINNRVLYRQSIRGTQNIDISNWGAGAYVIRVTIDGEIITKSIFIQK